MGQGVTLNPPVPLADHHDFADFGCGVATLDDWLRKRARANQASGASRTFVLCEEDRVVAYYALASGAVRIAEAPSSLRRNMPDPIPVAVLGRLAIDRAHQGRGLGRALVRDAALRLLQAAEILGIRALLVHAICDDAKNFYVATGFTPSPLDPMTLIVGLAELQRSLNA
jgi:GNAT superfamily N-acetyltransferase